MSLKTAIRESLRKIGRLPVISSMLFHRGVRCQLQTLPGMRLIYGSGWELLHPFDVELGVDTSGYVPGASLTLGAFATSTNAVYGGSQPSIIREVLKSLPGLAGSIFIDLGAGKARPVLVAGEFPFKEIVGVELSTGLVEIGRNNLSVVARRFPSRPPSKILNEDAATFAFPPGDLVVFLYNPFGASVVQRVVANLEKALADGPRAIRVVYYNPVHGAGFDASPCFQRYLARTIPYATVERGFGPDDADPVVVWQAGASYPAEKGADAKIVVVKPDYRVELVAE